MKMDKETLIKQRFWVLLGAVVPLVLLSVLVLWFGVRKAIAQWQAKVEQQVQAPTAIKNERNQEWISALSKQEKEVEKVWMQVWKEGWDSQAALVTWPTEQQKRFTRGLFATQIKVSRGGAAQPTQAPKPGPGGKPEAPAKGVQPPVKGAQPPPKGGKPPAKPDQSGKGAPGGVQTSAKEKGYLIRGIVKSAGKRVLVVQALVEKDPPAVGTAPVATKPQNPKDRFEKREFTFFIHPKMQLAVGAEQPSDAETFNGKIQDGDQVEVTYYSGKFFGDEFTEDEKEKYIDGYREQFRPLADFLKNAAGKRIVKLVGGWEGKKTIPIPNIIRHEEGWSRDPLPKAEEIWRAQEDLWIQRELLRAVQTANNYVARFQGTGGTQENATYVFSNPFWEFKLRRVRDNEGKAILKGNLTNVSRQRQNLGIDFLIQTTLGTKNSKPALETWRIAGEPLKPRERLEVTHPIKADNPDGLFAIEQVLEEATVPIKRLDKIALSQHSHRTFLKGLHPRHGKEVKKTPASNQAPGKTPGPGGKTPPPDMVGKVGGKGKDEKPDPNNRYSDATPQFRKMPVAMVLVVDQDSAHYLLTALEESKLRFQITQVVLTKAASFKDIAKKDQKDQPKPKGDGFRPAMGEFPKPGEFPPRGGFRPPGNGFPVPGPRDTGSAAPVSDQKPLMELVVYGYATLYERFPVRDAKVLPKPAAKPPAGK
jgi:hypothetical protein